VFSLNSLKSDNDNRFSSPQRLVDACLDEKDKHDRRASSRPKLPLSTLFLIASFNTSENEAEQLHHNAE